jgi:hypothetical protein
VTIPDAFFTFFAPKLPFFFLSLSFLVVSVEEIASSPSELSKRVRSICAYRSIEM